MDACELAEGASEGWTGACAAALDPWASDTLAARVSSVRTLVEAVAACNDKMGCDADTHSCCCCSCSSKCASKSWLTCELVHTLSNLTSTMEGNNNFAEQHDAHHLPVGSSGRSCPGQKLLITRPAVSVQLFAS